MTALKDSFALLKNAYEIVDFIYSLTDAKSSERLEPPNPYYGQTSMGLILEQHYGIPSSILTPFGKLSIKKNINADWQKVMAAIKEPLGLELLHEKEQKEFSSYGPYWAITKCGNSRLEHAAFRKRSDYNSAKKIEQLFREFLKQQTKQAQLPSSL